MGAGVRLATIGSLVGGGLGILGVAPSYGVAAERRLSGPLWLRVQGSAALQRTGTDLGDSVAYALSTGAGLRWALVELGPVELSTIGTLSVAWSDFDNRALGSPEPVEAHAISVGGAVGVAAEYAFNEALSLRLASDVAALTWNKSRYSSFDGTTVARIGTSSWAANLALEPSIEVRLRF